MNTDDRTPTRAECIAAAAAKLRLAQYQALTMPLDDAVKAALTPTGPKAAELREMLIAYRAKVREAAGLPVEQVAS